MQRNFDPSVGIADVYPQEITRVLLNLISNGFYATAKRKAVTASSQRYPPRRRILVTKLRSASATMALE